MNYKYRISEIKDCYGTWFVVECKVPIFPWFEVTGHLKDKEDALEVMKTRIKERDFKKYSNVIITEKSIN